jgi:Enoyl-CoA hydratase/isomerase
VPVPPTDDPVILEGEGAVAVIRLNRPAVLNAIDAATVEAFLAAVRRIASRPDLRAIVLKGSGRAFCAGGDVARFAGERQEVTEAVGSIIGPLHEAMTILADMPAPSIACLHGAVAGAGLSLALACDSRSPPPTPASPSPTPASARPRTPPPPGTSPASSACAGRRRWRCSPTRSTPPRRFGSAW